MKERLSYKRRTGSNPPQNSAVLQNPRRSTNKLYSSTSTKRENGGWLYRRGKSHITSLPVYCPPFKQGSARDKGAKSVATFPFHGTLHTHAARYTPQAAHCSTLCMLHTTSFTDSYTHKTKLQAMLFDDIALPACQF